MNMWFDTTALAPQKSAPMVFSTGLVYLHFCLSGYHSWWNVLVRWIFLYVSCMELFLCFEKIYITCPATIEKLYCRFLTEDLFVCLVNSFSSSVVQESIAFITELLINELLTFYFSLLHCSGIPYCIILLFYKNFYF